MYNMQYYDKIAVFDLDGTLWKVNSHYELLNIFYNSKFYTSLFYRCLCKFSPVIGERIRDKYFEKIPDSFISTVNFDFEEKILNLMNQKKNAGYNILVISNAPREIIVSNAAKRLGCKYLCAKIGEKSVVLKESFFWNELFVCTDNTTDIDLLDIATSYYLVFPNSRIKRFFKKYGFENE